MEDDKKKKKYIRKGELIEREGKRKAGLEKGRRTKKEAEGDEDNEGLNRKSLIFVLSTSDNLVLDGSFLFLSLCLNSRTFSVVFFHSFVSFTVALFPYFCPIIFPFISKFFSNSRHYHSVMKSAYNYFRNDCTNIT